MLKKSKKSTAICAFILGAAILATSAFADIIIGSGYYGLKNAAKTTAKKLANEVENFTCNFSGTIKIDNTVIIETNEKNKFDIVNQVSETISTNYSYGETSDRYYYQDKELSISKNSHSDLYYVYSRARNDGIYKIFDDPFEMEQVQDAEKVLDAFVGNLQDVIQVEESDGKKMYFGNLSDTQVPPLINAITSYVVKYGLFNTGIENDSKLLLPKDNIYVLSAFGKAIENADGIFESIIGGISVSGTDKNGAGHIYNIELAMDITNINNTFLTKPDLEGKQVTYSQGQNELDERYIGKYKNDIVKEENASFVKIGERYFEIYSINGSEITGRYYEVYNDDRAVETVRDFEITPLQSGANLYEIAFSYTENGKEKTGILHKESMQNIYVVFDVTLSERGGYSTNNYDESFDNKFVRIFD